MKKYIFLFLFIFNFIYIHNVYADTSYNNILNDVENGKAYLLCDYSSNDGNDGLRIYTDVKNNSEVETWAIFAKFDAGDYSLFSSSVNGDFLTAFNNKVHYNIIKNHLKSEDESTFKCTKYAYMDKGGFFDNRELCLTNTENGCGNFKKFNRSILKYVNNPSSQYSIIDSYVVDKINKLTLEDFETGNIDNIRSGAINSITSQITSQGNTVPERLKNYANNSVQDSEIVQKALNTRTDSLQKELDNKCNNGEYTEEECRNIRNNIASYTEGLKSTSLIDEEITECNAMLPAEVQKMLQNLLNFIKYGGLVLLGVFTIVDLIKASTSGDDGEMKKVYQRFLKRVIAAVLLFFIPLLVNVILDIFDITAPQYCIK